MSRIPLLQREPGLGNRISFTVCCWLHGYALKMRLAFNVDVASFHFVEILFSDTIFVLGRNILTWPS